jgi:hypothetical protein
MAGQLRAPLIFVESIPEGTVSIRAPLVFVEPLTEHFRQLRADLVYLEPLTEHFRTLRTAFLFVESLHPVPPEGHVSTELFPGSLGSSIALPGLAYTVHKRPRFSTLVHQAQSGVSVRNAQMQYPIWEFELSYEFLRDDVTNEYRTLLGFFLKRQGGFDTFLLKDKDDYLVTGGSLGTADGVTTQFFFKRTLGGFAEKVGQVDNGSDDQRLQVNGVLQGSGLHGRRCRTSVVFTSRRPLGSRSPPTSSSSSTAGSRRTWPTSRSSPTSSGSCSRSSSRRCRNEAPDHAPAGLRPRDCNALLASSSSSSPTASPSRRSQGAVVRLTDASGGRLDRRLERRQPAHLRGRQAVITGLKAHSSLGVEVDEQEFDIAMLTTRCSRTGSRGRRRCCRAGWTARRSAATGRSRRVGIALGGRHPACSSAATSELDSVGRSSREAPDHSGLSLLNLDMPKDLYGIKCRNVFGDARCGIDLNALAVLGTVGGGATRTTIPWASASSAIRSARSTSRTATRSRACARS